jgi:hypothetical protein
MPSVGAVRTGQPVASCSRGKVKTSQREAPSALDCPPSAKLFALYDNGMLIDRNFGRGRFMRSLNVLTAVLMFLLNGCSDEKTTAERAKADAERQAELKAEQRLMSDVALATAELEKRVAEWISSSNGLLFVVDSSSTPSFNLHAMPATTPWHVSCNAQEIEVTIGSWEESRRRNAKLFTRALSFAGFSEQQCKILAAVVARKLAAIVTAAR